MGSRSRGTGPATPTRSRCRRDFRSLGYDAVHKYLDDILGFECSPLSCNSLAQEWPVNRYCLLDDLTTAIEAARRFSIEKPEPGMYYVAEVFAEPF